MAWAEKAADNFNRADESPLSDGGNWSYGYNLASMKLASNYAINSSYWDYNASFRTGTPLKANQYSAFIHSVLLSNNTNYVGPVVRYSATDNFYVGIYQQNNQGKVVQILVTRSDGGTFTQLGSAISINARYDVARVEVIGTTIEVFVDGPTSKGTRTDSTYSAGYAGIFGQQQNQYSYIDDWSCGEEAAGGNPWHAYAMQ